MGTWSVISESLPKARRGGLFIAPRETTRRFLFLGGAAHGGRRCMHGFRLAAPPKNKKGVLACAGL